MSDVSDNDATDVSDDGELPSDAGSASQSHSEQDVDSDPGSDSGSDENEDEESHGDARGLLDLEASESGDDEDDGDDDESDRSSAYGKRTDGLLDGSETISFWTDYEFPQFAQLPPELRCRVWELFSPMICAESRIVTVELRMIGDVLRVDPEFVFVLQYASVATLLQINHESRDIVLKALPDTLAVCDDDCSLVRFNRSKDVVGLVNLDGWKDWMEPDPLRPENAQHYQIPGFSENVEHLSLHDVKLDSRGAITPPPNSLGDPAHIFGLLMTFPNLKAVYELKYSNKLPMRSMHWCGQEDSTNTYELRHLEENDYGVETETRFTYVWPKIDKFEFPDSRENLPEVVDLGVWAEEFSEDNPPEMPPNFEDSDGNDEFPLMVSEVLAGIEMWPMVLFRCGAGQRRLQRLKDTKLEDLDDDEEVELDSDAEDWVDMDNDREDHDGDDLESEEDDGEMDDFIEYDDFDQDARSDPPQGGEWDAENPGDGDEDDLDLGHEAGAPLFIGFSPTQDSSGAETDNAGDDDGNGGLLESDDADDDVRPSKKRKARRVVDSDDEEDEDEDEDVRPTKIQRRSRRIVAPDSEDEDEDEQTDSGSDGAPVRDTKLRGNHSDSSATEDDSDSEDEGATIDRGRNLTFAERLSLHRTENPLDSDGASNSNGPESSDEATDHIASDDDSGEDDDGNSNGMVDHYAEDMGDGEENGSDDDGGW
ncbi:uncharacterized protein PpBr36_06152 [Pyricularia pennisetigena]|uniref:uncharacterized protein n=1 Tax=Pyricularia pennisetigena TaxID=1578925 RepID=UPI001151788A|nr:uncharacterized protein PpBr36_06152 [Pyricularia pennisetigena]TLS23471.1 hypothetical protein PpBr36_06152 [Pyricularia pennisetigena]